MTFSVILDLIVICLMGVTIFYAIRLSRSIKSLRNDRRHLEKLVADLGRSVTAAENAIHGLRNSAKDTGQTLQDRIVEGRTLVSELELITESADKIAGRLTNSATRPGRRQRDLSTSSAPAPPAPVKGGFAIRDLEFEGPKRAGGEDSFESDDDAEAEAEFQSRAEKELYEALRVKRRGPGGAK